MSFIWKNHLSLSLFPHLSSFLSPMHLAYTLTKPQKFLLSRSPKTSMSLNSQIMLCSFHSSTVWPCWSLFPSSKARSPFGSELLVPSTILVSSSQLHYGFFFSFPFLKCVDPWCFVPFPSHVQSVTGWYCSFTYRLCADNSHISCILCSWALLTMGQSHADLKIRVVRKNLPLLFLKCRTQT